MDSLRIKNVRAHPWSVERKIEGALFIMSSERRSGERERTNTRTVLVHLRSEHIEKRNIRNTREEVVQIVTVHLTHSVVYVWLCVCVSAVVYYYIQYSGLNVPSHSTRHQHKQEPSPLYSGKYYWTNRHVLSFTWRTVYWASYSWHLPLSLPLTSGLLRNLKVSYFWHFEETKLTDKVIKSHRCIHIAAWQWQK